MTLQDLSDAQDQYCKYIRIAEKAIKKAESRVCYENPDGTEVSGLCIPAINELRCAAYHISLAFSNVTDEEKLSGYRNAIGHCKRAAYEALDSLLQFYIKELHAFQKDYETVLIGDTLPAYLEDCVFIDSVIDEQSNREDITLDDISTQEAQLAKLEGIWKKWKAARQELNKQLTRSWYPYISWGISILSIIAAIIMGILAYFK